MKKSALPALLLFVCSYIFGQIPNADMELWDNQPVLLGWNTNSAPLTLPPYDPYIIRKDTDAYSGSFAANFWGNNVIKPRATTVFALTAHPQDLSLYYKLSFPPCVNDAGWNEKDTASVLIEVLNQGQVIDNGYWESTVTNFTYSPLTIPVTQNSGLFDSCRITITGGKVYGGCGFAASSTEFKVDHLQMKFSSCENTGVMVNGVEMGCLLIDTGTGNLLFACNISLASQGLVAGDSISFSFSPNTGCGSFCMQGTSVDISCLRRISSGSCILSVATEVHQPTSHPAYNGSLVAQLSGGLTPYLFVWSNGISGYGIDSIGSLNEGYYCVTVSDNNGCTASACNSLLGTDVCIDTNLICPPGSLCCDAPLQQPVCGCDSVTYMNSCVATFFGGVTSAYEGGCITTGLNSESTDIISVKIVPNPAENEAELKFELLKNSSVTYLLKNCLGQIFQLQSLGKMTAGYHQTRLNVSTLPSGIYLIEIIADEKVAVTKKLAKN